jgi:hypothetical protein
MSFMKDPSKGTLKNDVILSEKKDSDFGAQEPDLGDK